MNIPENISVFAYLNNTFKNRWEIKNPTPIDYPNESRAALYIELYIDGRCCVGCYSDNKDFSRDIDKKLLEHATRNALCNFMASCPPKFTKEQVEFMRNYAVEHDIKTTEQWDSHIKAWNKDMTKAKLDEKNIDGFINFAKQLKSKEIEAKELG